MTADAVSRTSLALLAAIGVSVAASQADVVFAPLALAVFIIALVSPLQSWLKQRAPALIALALTMTLTILVMVAFASLAVWGFSRVGRSIISDSGRYQAIYDAAVAWLDSHGVSIAGLWSEHFNVGWLSAQRAAGHRPPQHDPDVLDHHPRLRDHRPDGGRGHRAQGARLSFPTRARAG